VVFQRASTIYEGQERAFIASCATTNSATGHWKVRFYAILFIVKAELILCEMFRRNSQQKQKSISQSPRSTPSYIQRQLDQIAQQQQSLAQINASTLSYEKGSEQHSPLPSEQLLPLTQMLHQLRQKSLAEVPPSTVTENEYGHHVNILFRDWIFKFLPIFCEVVMMMN